MKTTVELPDAVVMRAKIMAAERQTTLRALILKGLESVLDEQQVTSKERARKLFAQMDKLPAFSAKNRLSRAQANAR